jgi:putative ABC transport system permease protein
MSIHTHNIMDTSGDVPRQTPVPWAVAYSVSWGSLRRRIMRSLITMVGVVLGIAFLTYMLVTDDITGALVHADIAALNVMLQKAGVDIFGKEGTDSRMVLLISLSLLTCLVGIINAMLMSVTERIKEIGTMKCLGALNSFILKTYFIEASLQGVIGTCIGMVLGLLVAVTTSAVSYGGHVAQLFPWADVVLSLGLGFAIGTIISVVAAVAPAQWAATKEPVEAMRAEE